MEEMKQESKQNIFDVLGPKRSFTFGMVFAVMAFCTLGFFYLLVTGSGGLSKGSSSDKVFSASNTNSATNTNTAAATTTLQINSVTAEDHIRGNLDTAEAVFVEYSDLECPFCKQYHETVKQMQAEYGDRVAWVYRHFPLDSLHPKARNEAEASECAAELGGNDGFWKYIDRLYEITPANNGLDPAQLPEIAQFAGLDVTKFNECLSSGRHADKVEEHYQDATQNAGGQGTPHSVILTSDGRTKAVSGAVTLATLKSNIDAMLQ